MTEGEIHRPAMPDGSRNIRKGGTFLRKPE